MKKDHKFEGNSYIPQKELAEALKINFPSVFSDGKVDCEKLKLALGENYQLTSEKYGLSWTGKSDCFREIQLGITATLKPNKEESVDFDKTGNVFIEGDNLEALKVLQRSYYGKIKCIYIDPPYNTGNDFIYNDNFRKTRKEEMEDSGELDGNGDLTRADGLSVNHKDSNGHFHSDWLNMMYPRLFLARNLLKQDGVIFVSIDDNEVHNLRMIMNEIFGEENFVGEIIWHKKTQPSFLSREIATVKENILFYKKTSSPIYTYGGKTNPDKNIELLNISNNLCKRTFSKDNILIKNGDYSGILKKGKYGRSPLQVELFEDLRVETGRVTKDFVLEGRFKWGQEKINKSFSEGDIFHFKSVKSLRPTIEKREKIVNLKPIIDILSKKFNKDIATNTDASNEMNSLFKKKEIFTNPKPTKLIKYLIKSVTYSDLDSIILDFFAGSGTTAQAVMEQNAEDGGNRKWICVQLPELCDEKSEAFKAGYKNIAEIAKERIRRAGSAVAKAMADKEEKEDISTKGGPASGWDIGFKSFKLDKSNFKIWQGKFRDEKSLLSALDEFVDNLEKGSNKENILYELILKSGLDLNVPIKEKEIESSATAKAKADKEKYFDLGNGKLFIYLGENISIKMAEKFIEMKPEKIICLERAFQNNDELKTNILLQSEQEDVDFKVV
jgi:adenine-specific DNA-methyltransferase